MPEGTQAIGQKIRVTRNKHPDTTPCGEASLLKAISSNLFGSKELFDEVCFTFDSDCNLAGVGPTSAGKTTLLRNLS